MAIDCIAEIPGAVELSKWFGGFPSFHDANAELQINGDGTGWLKAYGFGMTDKVDQNGYYVLEKHFVATFLFEKLRSVALTEFQPGRSILYDLDIKKSGDSFEISFGSSYGVAGSIIAERLSITFEIGVKAP